LGGRGGFWGPGTEGFKQFSEVFHRVRVFLFRGGHNRALKKFLGSLTGQKIFFCVRAWQFAPEGGHPAVLFFMRGGELFFSGHRKGQCPRGHRGEFRRGVFVRFQGSRYKEAWWRRGGGGTPRGLGGLFWHIPHFQPCFIWRLGKKSEFLSRVPPRGAGVWEFFPGRFWRGTGNWQVGCVLGKNCRKWPGGRRLFYRSLVADEKLPCFPQRRGVCQNCTSLFVVFLFRFGKIGEFFCWLASRVLAVRVEGCWGIWLGVVSGGAGRGVLYFPLGWTGKNQQNRFLFFHGFSSV